MDDLYVVTVLNTTAFFEKAKFIVRADNEEEAYHKVVEANKEAEDRDEPIFDSNDKIDVTPLELENDICQL